MTCDMWHMQIGSSKFGDFELEVIDPVADYMATLKEVRMKVTCGHSNN